MLQNLRNAAHYVPKSFIPVLALLLAVAVPSALFAWGPERQTFTMANPAEYVTFNSITDNPNYGDEREFMTISDLTAGGQQVDTANLQPGHEYRFQLYIHNNAGSNLNASGQGVAHDVMVRAQLPASINGTGSADGFISASNARPGEVYDSAALTSDGQVELEYVNGSARLHTNAQQTTLPDSLITTGVRVGDADLGGDWRGCLEYAGAVSFTVRVKDQTPPAPQPTPQSSFDFKKQVRAAGSTAWQESYTARPGEAVEFLLEYRNTGETTQDNVVLSDELPAGMSYVAGSSRLGNAENPNGVTTDDGVTADGLNIGRYGAGGNGWVIFRATAPADSQLECGRTTLTNSASALVDGQRKTDQASLRLDKTCQPPAPVTPAASYSCDQLRVVSQLDRDSFIMEVDASAANGASIKEYRLVLDDGQERISTNKRFEYSYSEAGLQRPRAYVSFTVDGRTITNITSDACSAELTVAQPTTPAVLPSTGPAETAALSGIFGGGILGYGIHAFSRSRRNLRNAFRK